MAGYVTYTIDLEGHINYYRWNSKALESSSHIILPTDIITYIELDVLLAVF